MSLQEVIEFVNARPSGNVGTLGELYGTESFCLFLYTLLRMEQPEVVVELGIGAGVTSFMAAQALRENGRGHLWAVDNGMDWTKQNASAIRQRCQSALGYDDPTETYEGFIAKLATRFEVSERMTHVDAELTATEFYAPADRKVDVVFADAPPSHAEGCINLLRYYLPRMSDFSSIFIDRASTINHSYVVLNYVVEQLNRGKIPAHLLDGLTDEQERETRRLVSESRFTIVHLTETDRRKLNRKQNSRAWIKIEPEDYLPHNNVLNFV